MPLSRTRFPLAVIAACLVGLGVAACGSGSTTTVTERQTTTFFVPSTGSDGAGAASGDSSTTAATSAGGSGGLDFQMGEFFYRPEQTTVASGPVKVTVDNIGAVTHEWVLAKTDLDAANLPTLPDGEVDEDKLDSPGEIPDVVSGAKDEATLDLKPGKYVFFCNLPAHYAGGMYGSLEVTGG
jgi:uncharacterized cupredoxin-like copper-binding protein